MSSVQVIKTASARVPVLRLIGCGNIGDESQLVAQFLAHIAYGGFDVLLNVITRKMVCSKWGVH